ncbi:GNAT family N-acetyltransferase [Agrococcus sp. Marseille-Q4369]|uniref:lipid II:glycine glycyltransferase FemX n=1 Tax=Agrococcus sp. Marseille-Q4369 TaxID=2810513 RepID=UPI001B8D1F32|nr:GNAT family N-acetyltransferase [Agrococcus sp. Marseille-Q4369]QUW19332.1 peptidoglycan bridge formation glycyltransferase FemA/FemB family protein [Agrococcus sp. Marseille-Q4369]
MPAAAAVRRATPGEIVEWDALIEANPDGGHMVQSSAFAATKRFDGLEPVHLVIDAPLPASTPTGEPTERIHALALEGKVSLGRYWYLPMGPTATDMAPVVEALREFAKAEPGLLVVKIEPHLERSAERINELVALGLEQSRDMQVMTHTVVLDLAQGEEALFASFSQMIRRQVRGAIKKGYRVERPEPSPETFDRMHAMMLTVAGGKGMAGMRERAYYDRFWSEFAKASTGRFYFGYDDDSDDPQAGIFVTTAGRTAVYKDGGSRPDRKINGGSALLLWTAMQDAIADGKLAFDLAGTPPPERADDPTHPFHGLAQFKLRFGPISSFLPSFDLVLHPVRHRVWESVVRRVEWRIKKGPDTLR